MGLDIYFNKGLKSKREINKAKIEKLGKSIDKVFDQRYKCADKTSEKYQKLEDKYHKLCDRLEKLQPKEAAYFRKVNFLIPFFGYEDDCTCVDITKDKVEALVDACKKVLKDHSLASELLPTTDGFFFGGTEYDEWYFQDVKEVLDVFKKLSKINFDRYFLEMYCWW